MLNSFANTRPPCIDMANPPPGLADLQELAQKPPHLRLALAPQEASLAPTDAVVTSSLVRWLHTAGQALIVVDGDLVVQWANDAAHQRLQFQADLSIRHRRLTHFDATCTEKLAKQVRATSSVKTSLCLPASKSSEHVLIKTERADAANGNPFYILTLTRTDDNIGRYVHVDEVFGLTPSEARILNDLAQGRTAEEAARAAKVKIETVRTHIKSIYAKVGVNNREALLHRLHPFRA